MRSTWQLAMTLTVLTEDSASKLRDARTGAFANRVAAIITSQPKRDAVLMKLATSP